MSEKLSFKKMDGWKYSSLIEARDELREELSSLISIEYKLKAEILFYQNRVVELKLNMKI